MGGLGSGGGASCASRQRLGRALLARSSAKPSAWPATWDGCRSSNSPSGGRPCGAAPIIALCIQLFADSSSDKVRGPDISKGNERAKARYILVLKAISGCRVQNLIPRPLQAVPPDAVCSVSHARIPRTIRIVAQMVLPVRKTPGARCRPARGHTAGARPELRRPTVRVPARPRGCQSCGEGRPWAWGTARCWPVLPARRRPSGEGRSPQGR